MKNLNEELLSSILSVGRLIKERVHTDNCLINLTGVEIEILRFLHGRKEIAMKSIAKHLHIKPSSVTPVIDNLVKKGDLKRVQMANDRRIVNIVLTSKGIKSLNKTYGNMHKTIAKVFEKISAQDKKNLIKIFQKIHAKNI